MGTLSVFDAAREYPRRVAVIADGVEHSFTDMAVRAARAAAVVAKLPPGPLAFVARTDVATVALIHALFALGRPMVPLHPRWTEAERAAAPTVLAESIIVVDPNELAASQGADLPAVAEPRTQDDAAPAAYLFTSGTTRDPKAVVLPRRAFLASAHAHRTNLPFALQDRWLVAMPLAHAGGLSIVTRSLLARTAIVLMPRYDADEMLDIVARERVSLLSVVPSMLHALLERDGRGTLALPRAVLVGGAAWPTDLRRRARAAGVLALATYGLTETCSQIATQRPDDPIPDAPHEVGPALSGARVEVRRPDGRQAEVGARGRIWVGGSMVMTGYAGASSVAVGEPIDTGDDGWVDARGVLSVLGRADDTIVTGGENVQPAEIEAILAALPGVREAAVFGVPDPVWGHLVAAALVVSPGVDPAAVCVEAGRTLAPFKRPRLFTALYTLPRLSSGKLDRRALRAIDRALLTPVTSR